jgi:hypothetical protein
MAEQICVRVCRLFLPQVERQVAGLTGELGFTISRVIDWCSRQFILCFIFRKEADLYINKLKINPRKLVSKSQSKKSKDKVSG